MGQRIPSVEVWAWLAHHGYTQPQKRGDVIRVKGPSVPMELWAKWFVVTRVDPTGNADLSAPYDTQGEARMASWQLPSVGAYGRT